MDSSSAGTPEHTPTHSGERPQERPRWNLEIPAKRVVRALLVVEAASFLVAATVHAGVLVGGYEHGEAMIAESLIGAVLLVGLATTWVRPRSMFSIAAGVQAFALLGTLVGIWTIVVGVGPRTTPDVVYHVVIAVVLLVGVGVAWRARGAGSTRAER